MHAFSDSQGVSPTDPIEPIKAIGADQKKMVSPTPFQEYMKQGTPANPQAQFPSPFDLPKNTATPTTVPSIDALMGQFKAGQNQIAELTAKLSTPNLQLNHAERYLVGNKLADAKAHINSATSKLGVEPPPPKDTSEGNILVKFLNTLQSGSYQMQQATEQLGKMKSEGGQINPAEFLSIQMKVGKASAEMEYATILLAKAVDSTKQLFNIQL